MSGGIGIMHWLITAFSYVLALRFLLQLVQADFYNPVSQYVLKFSDPVCGPIRKFIPAKGRFDWASLLLMLALYVAFWLVVQKNSVGFPSSALAPFAYSGFNITSIFLNVFFVALIVLVILSWLMMANPGAAQNPVWPIVNQLVEPLAAPLRRIIPPLGGLDLSVLVLFLGIQFAKMLNAQFWSLWLR